MAAVGLGAWGVYRYLKNRPTPAELERRRRNHIHSRGKMGDANLLIMPTLDAANVAFNLLKTAAADGVTIGPILLGCARAAHIVTPSATVRRLVNMTALAVVDANAQRTLFSA